MYESPFTHHTETVECATAADAQQLARKLRRGNATDAVARKTTVYAKVSVRRDYDPESDDHVRFLRATLARLTS